MADATQGSRECLTPYSKKELRDMAFDDFKVHTMPIIIDAICFGALLYSAIIIFKATTF